MKLKPLVEHEYLVKVIDKNNPKANPANYKGLYVGANKISEAIEKVEETYTKPRYSVIDVKPIR